MTDQNPREAVIEKEEALYCHFRPDGIITYVNKPYCKFFKKSSEELIGTNFKSTILPEASQSVDLFLSSFTPLCSHQIIDYPVLLPDGTFRWLKWAENSIFDPEGKLLEFHAVGQDITEGKEAQIRLQEREKCFTQLVELCPMAISVHDGEKFLFLNQAGIELLGAVKLEDLIGKSVLDFVHPHNRPMVKERIKIAMENGEITTLQEIKLLKISKEEIYVETVTGPIRFQGKLCVQVLARDVSKGRSLARALKEKEIALTQLWKQFEVEKREMHENLVANTINIILPLLEKGKVKGLTGKNIREVIQHMGNITSPYGKKIASQAFNLTAREIEICGNIKNGKSNKEIAKLLKIDTETVERHRNNIRKKLNLVKKDVNLNAFLQSM